MASVTQTFLNRRALLRTSAAILAGSVIGATWMPRLAEAASVAKVGLIDLTLNPETLSRYPGVTVRHMSFWATGYIKAKKQSRDHAQDHGEVMARELIEAYQALAQGAALELYIASPFIENAEGRKLLDVDQLMFAFDWFASQGVKIVALTFVGRNTPTLSAALEHAHRLGLVVLASAGNGPSQNPVPAYPAAYGSVIAIGTTGLSADRSAEDAKLHKIALTEANIPSSRGGYVDYAVKAPQFTTVQLRRDRELLALQGSSRATVVAAGVLVALSGGAVETTQEACDTLDHVAVPVDAEIAARGVIDLNALSTTVRLRQPLRASRDREAA